MATKKPKICDTDTPGTYLDEKGVRRLKGTEQKICDVCGRPLPPKKGKRGRPRDRHKECTIVMSRLDELYGMIPRLRFMPPGTTPGSNALRGHAKEMRSKLFGLSRVLTSQSTKCATDSRDYYVPEAAKKGRRERLAAEKRSADNKRKAAAAAARKKKKK